LRNRENGPPPARRARSSWRPGIPDCAGILHAACGPRSSLVGVGPAADDAGSGRPESWMCSVGHSLYLIAPGGARADGEARTRDLSLGSFFAPTSVRPRSAIDIDQAAGAIQRESLTHGDRNLRRVRQTALAVVRGAALVQRRIPPAPAWHRHTLGHHTPGRDDDEAGVSMASTILFAALPASPAQRLDIS
jgi:hypothetical protein